jgi:hypothetical protein
VRLSGWAKKCPLNGPLEYDHLATKLAHKKSSFSKPASSAAREAESFIPPEFLARHRAAIETAMHARLRDWGAHGWRIIGSPPRVRLEVVVPETVQRALVPVQTIKVAGRTIKPAVRASRVAIRKPRATAGDTPTAIGFARAVAPGARIRVGRGALQEFVGVAAVLVIAGKPAILTCGHADAFKFSGELLPGDDADGVAIANLQTNFLSEPSPLDAAICPLTDAGRALLSESKAAPTWRFKTTHPPAVGDNDQTAVFWQTHDGNDSAPTAKIESFSGESHALFGARGPSEGFIETGHAVRGGDSGSLLSLESSLYGICSGFVGFTAFFTPITTVLERLKGQGISCSIFTPPAA